MQRYCTELTERLLKSLDKEYNVVDMGAVVDVITALEKTTITKEVLEITRLGKYINELRRKTSNDALAKRAKDLVRRWRDMVLPSAHATPQPTPADTAPQALNGTKPQSPALRGLKPHSPAPLRGLKPHSPALKNLKPHSPLMRDATPLKQVLSPALSLHSDHSRSPNPTPTKHHPQQQPPQEPPSSAPSAPTTTRVPNPTNNRLNSDLSPKLGSVSTQNHSLIEAVPRTHSSNKRLRKEEAPSPATSPHTTPPLSTSTSVVKSIRGDSNDSLASRLEPSAKRPRLNGELGNFSSLSKYSESYASNNNLVASSRSSLSNSGSRPLSLNQVPSSPRDTEKATTERFASSLSDVSVSTSVENSRDAADSSTTTSATAAAAAAAAAAAGPKKRGRKKGSKSLKSQSLPEDRVKEKLASISRNPKLKTTQELLADLQARGSSLGAGGTTTGSSGPARGTEPPSNEEILRNAGNDDRPLSARFLRSGREKSGNARSANFGDSPRTRGKSGSAGKRWETTNRSDDEGDARTEDNARGKELTVEEILAKLPPLDLDAISWSDCDEETEDVGDDEDEEDATVKEIRPEDVDRLHEECVEGLNGNFQAKLRVSRDDDETGGDATRDKKVEDIRSSDAWSIAELKKKGVYRRLGGNEDDREFREWHEMLARPSYDGQTLHILPYVIID